MQKHKNKPLQIIQNHIMNNRREYFSVIITLLIGIVIGVITLNNTDDNTKQELQNYINNSIHFISENQEIDKLELLKSILTNNLILVIVLIFLGTTVIGVPVVYAIVAYKGFCFSYTVSSIIATLGTSKGFTFIISSILLQNCIYIPCIIALAVSGIKLYKSIVKEKKHENIKFEILRHLMFSGFMGGILCLGSLIEVYISSNILISISSIFEI